MTKQRHESIKSFYQHKVLMDYAGIYYTRMCKNWISISYLQWTWYWLYWKRKKGLEIGQEFWALGEITEWLPACNKARIEGNGYS